MSAPPLDALVTDAASLLDDLRAQQLKIATAESCTGGLIAAILTEVAGSSTVVDRSFVTYSNDAKRDMLGVPEALLQQYGAVSEPVVRSMVSGALEHSPADIAVAVTGIAGPGGGSVDKPVGLVHLAVQRRGRECIYSLCEFGDVGRSDVRRRTVQEAFKLVRSLL